MERCERGVHAKVFIVLLLWILPVSLTMPQITIIASTVIPLLSLPDEPQPSLTFGPSLSFRTWFALRSYVPLLPRRAFFSSWTRKTWKSWRSWQKRISPVNDSKLLWKWELRRCVSEQRSKRQQSILKQPSASFRTFIFPLPGTGSVPATFTFS